MAENGPTPRTYVWTATWLMVLLGVTIGAAYIPMGPFGPVVAMLIAAAKAGLVAVMFMHLRWDSPMVRLFAGAGLLWLAILIGGTLNDYATRLGPPYIPQELPYTEAAQDPGAQAPQPTRAR